MLATNNNKERRLDRYDFQSSKIARLNASMKHMIDNNVRNLKNETNKVLHIFGKSNSQE